MCHIPFSDVPAEAGRPGWLDALCHRHGPDGDDLAADLKVARSIRVAATDAAKTAS